MKLTPKPSPKAKSTSRASTSTPPTAKASSSTKMTLTLETDEYTGVDQHGQAVPTAHQTQQEKQKRTRTSIGIFFPQELDAFERKEAQILGQAMAQMPWLSVAADSEPFILGFTQGEGEIEELGGRNFGQFDGAVLYRQPEQDDPAHTKIVRLEDRTQLKAFATGTITELYRRGILV